MCTIITEEIKTKKKTYAWKVVLKCSSDPRSLYYSTFRWYPNKTVKASGQKSKIRSWFGMDDRTIHCFARRSDARQLKETQWWHSKGALAIIKVELRGRIFKGLTGGMGRELDDLPALCATEVYWDGKFSR